MNAIAMTTTTRGTTAQSRPGLFEDRGREFEGIMWRAFINLVRRSGVAAIGTPFDKNVDPPMCG
tara:strand:- start:4428 stop:4619 length:192 start_codon:yes stop_codon:yes gene_type:complete